MLQVTHKYFVAGIQLCGLAQLDDVFYAQGVKVVYAVVGNAVPWVTFLKTVLNNPFEFMCDDIKTTLKTFLSGTPLFFSPDSDLRPFLSDFL